MTMRATLITDDDEEYEVSESRHAGAQISEVERIVVAAHVFPTDLSESDTRGSDIIFSTDNAVGSGTVVDTDSGGTGVYLSIEWDSVREKG